MRLAAQNCVAERTLFKGQLHARFVILFCSLKYLVLFINGQSSCLSLLNMPSRVPLPLGSDEVAKCSSFDELIVLLRCPMCVGAFRFFFGDVEFLASFALGRILLCPK